MIDKKIIDQVVSKLTTPVTHNHFFMKINDPSWVKPLSEKGYFKHPTPAIREGSYISFPSWAEGEYLVRVADKAQDKVLEIIKNMPDTDNERVMTNVVDALLKIDTVKAIEMTSKVKGYIDKPQYLLLDKSIGDLIVKFANDGAEKEAAELARAALEVMPDPEAETESKKEFSWLHPRTRFSDYDYEEMVKKITPVLADKAPDKAVDIYADLVKDMTRYKHADIKEAKSNKSTLEDWSLIWRPVIEDTGEHTGTIDILINAFIDSLEVLIKSDKITNKAKAKQLNGLLSIKLAIIKRSIEYALRNNRPTQELEDIHRPLAREFARIIKQPAVRFGGGGIVEDKFAFTQEEFDALDDNALLEKLKTYEPESSLYSDREALSNNVESATKNNPDRFTALLPKIADTKYLYLYSVVDAFYKNIDCLKPEQIGRIAKTLVKIFKRELKATEEGRHDYYEWANMSAARFVEKAFDKNEDKKRERIILKEADAVLDLALLMCRSDDPTVKHEKEEEGSLDPATLSLNTIRGVAMHSIIHAMVWANRNKVDNRFMNRVFDELSRSLKDPTQAIRTVYGMHYENICGTRKKWAEANKGAIFSDDELGRAAIDAYTSYSSVYPDAVDILGDVYERQLPRLAVEPPEENKRGIARTGLKHLVQHLSLHYWYGTMDLSDNSLMKKLLDTAHPKYLAEVTHFIGFRLYKADENERKIADEELNRLTGLWKYVVSLAEEDANKKEALEDFGTWFASGKFDDDWSLDQLLVALKFAGSVDLDFAVLERLEKLVATHPSKAVGIIDAMVDGSTRDRWAIGSWRDDAVSILTIAGKSSDEAIRQSVRDLANKLVRNGYEEYRNVI